MDSAESLLIEIIDQQDKIQRDLLCVLRKICKHEWPDKTKWTRSYTFVQGNRVNLLSTNCDKCGLYRSVKQEEL